MATVENDESELQGEGTRVEFEKALERSSPTDRAYFVQYPLHGQDHTEWVMQLPPESKVLGIGILSFTQSRNERNFSQVFLTLGLSPDTRKKAQEAMKNLRPSFVSAELMGKERLFRSKVR